ncbi:polyprenyl synthetase family protein [Erysipelothrix sp. D19-032]
MATLVHDDVMDDADTRRGVTTLHKKYGRKTTVICGDYLMAAVNVTS